MRLVVDLVLKLIDKFRGVEQIDPLVTNIEPSGLKGVNNMDDTENSGSVGQDTVYSKDQYMNEYMSQIIELMLDPNDMAKMANVPYYMISGSGPAWYYAPKSRTFAMVNRGSEVWIASKNPDDRGRYYVYTNELIVLIPKEELVRIEFN